MESSKASSSGSRRADSAEEAKGRDLFFLKERLRLHLISKENLDDRVLSEGSERAFGFLNLNVTPEGDGEASDWKASDDKQRVD